MYIKRVLVMKSVTKFWPCANPFYHCSIEFNLSSSAEDFIMMRV